MYCVLYCSVCVFMLESHHWVHDCTVFSVFVVDMCLKCCGVLRQFIIHTCPHTNCITYINVCCCDLDLSHHSLTSSGSLSVHFRCCSHCAHFPVYSSAVPTIRLKIKVESTTMALSRNWKSPSLVLYLRLYSSLLLLQSAGSSSDFLSLLRGWRRE